MLPETTLLLSQFILLGGLAAWMATVATNNCLAFANGVFTVGMLMNMKPFEEAPAIASPLLSRRVASAAWHRAVYSVIVVLEVLTAALLLLSAGNAALEIIEYTPSPGAALPTIGLTALLGLVFLMMSGGAWFGYYIRQELIQLTHIGLAVLAVVALIFVNLVAG